MGTRVTVVRYDPTMGEGRWIETWMDRNFIYVSMPYGVGKSNTYLGT